MSGVSEEKLNERQKRILEILQTRGTIAINELAERFNVHPMTIRRDIKKFEKMGILVRTYGGAYANPGRRVLRYLSNEDINYNIEKKVAIANYIVENLISDNDYIFLDSGSTMLQIARFLIKRKKITVVTNSIDIMAELYHHSDINTLIPGGSLSMKSSSLHGPYAVERLKEISVNASFLSCDGVVLGPHGGFYTNHDIEANLNPYALKTGRKRYIAADSDKIGKLCPYKFADFEDVDLFITDSGIKEKYLEELSKYVKVAVAEIKPL